MPAPAFADYDLDPKPFAGDLVQLLGLLHQRARGELVRKPRSGQASGFAAATGEARRRHHPPRSPAIFVYGDSFSDAWLAPLSDVASRVVYRRNDHPLHASEVLAEKPGLFIYEIVQRRVSEPPQPLVSP
jgi:hypothetical protein